MPFGTTKTASYADKEILKYAAQLGPRKSIVLDAKNWPEDPEASSSRYVVPAGTIRGILAAPVDLVARATSAMEPGAMFFHAVVFATSALVGFTNYASAVVSTLNTCKFE